MAVAEPSTDNTATQQVNSLDVSFRLSLILNFFALITMIAAVVLAVCVSASSASCSSALDCSLNGECVSGACVCDEPWTGDACGALAFKTTPAVAKSLYNISDPRNTWNGPIVGPVELEMNPGGEIKMFIPRCWMHTAPGDGRTQDQACVQGCKGACERVFNGRTPVAMEFEPHLPDFSCTLRVKLDRGAMPAR